MYTTGAPVAATERPLRITGALRREFRKSSATAQDDRLPGFITDMVGPYGLHFDSEPYQANLGQSFSEMCEPLVTELVSEPVELLVLAYDLHDLRPGQATSIYLSQVCPGQPLAFAVCDQGNAAPHTALSLIQSYARTGGLQHALLLVAEQSTLHYRPLHPTPLPQRHVAAAFRLEAGPGCTTTVRTDVAPDRVSTELRALLPAGGGVVVLGNELAAGLTEPLPLATVAAPPGQPLTGSWWGLAEQLPGEQTVVVADFEPRLGYLSVTVQEPAPVAAARS